MTAPSMNAKRQLDLLAESPCGIASTEKPQLGTRDENAAVFLKEFSWDADDVDVVIHYQPAVAVYLNNGGDVVIRQERRWDEDEDPFIIVRPENLAPLISALNALLARR